MNKWSRLIDTEKKLVVARGEWFGGLDAKVQELSRTKQQLQSGQGNGRYSTESTVNEVVTVEVPAGYWNYRGITL